MALSTNLLLTGEVLRQKWRSFANRCGIPADQQLSLSNGWMERFKKRHGLREFKRHGEAASADQEDQSSGVKGKKTRLTYAFTVNADGSDKLPPLVIGRWKKPRTFGNHSAAQLGFLYRNNAKAWMTTILYQEWILNLDRDMVAKGRNILLLQDNFSAHVPPEELRAIRVKNFKANLTAHVQPDDQGIIRCFKAHYRAKFIERAINRYDSGITPSAIYDINQLEAMRLAEAAWREVDATTIRHCWRKAGILPIFPDTPVPMPTIPISSLLRTDAPDPVAEAESSVERALDELVDTGALQKANRMDLNSLLNPAVEAQVISEISEEDIFCAVQEQKETGDGAGGDDEPVEVCPTRSEVLQAAALLTRYSGSVDDPLARKLEDLLARFTRQVRIESQASMRNTSITNYFARK
ncbi:DDE-domain-containing protein [Polyporus arcularius HHB13444]|uniref:DDE-domain-containing protein n=1 Tax=Polyporus arcularius HHB13444 TaxID=1314778 RepID=A0A5C3PRC2_9APHY|nr:DDE-domain-containing protein [Polyporus arcularius HHB13444]